MRLQKASPEGYQCELTKELDTLAGMDKEPHYSWFHHYILVNPSGKTTLSIRVPGGTVGAIWLDDERRVTKVEIDTNYVVRSYPADVETQVQHFVGEKIEW